MRSIIQICHVFCLVFNSLMMQVITMHGKGMPIDICLEKYKEVNPPTSLVDIPETVHLIVNEKLGKGGWGKVFHGKVKDIYGEIHEVIVKKASDGLSLKTEMKAGKDLMAFYNTIGPDVLFSDIQGFSVIVIPRGCADGIVIQKKIDGINCWYAMHSRDLNESPFANGFVDDPQVAIRRICRLVLGLHGLHRSGRIHGDVKTSNIMVGKYEDQFQFWIIDLGLSTKIGKKIHAASANGAPETTSPRTSRERELGKITSFALDIYTFGTMLPDLLFGKNGQEFSLIYFWGIKNSNRLDFNFQSRFVKKCQKSEEQYGKDKTKAIILTWMLREFQKLNVKMKSEIGKFYPEPVLQELAKITADCLSMDPQDRPLAKDILQKLTHFALFNWEMDPQDGI